MGSSGSSGRRSCRFAKTAAVGCGGMGWAEGCLFSRHGKRNSHPSTFCIRACSQGRRDPGAPSTAPNRGEPGSFGRVAFPWTPRPKDGRWPLEASSPDRTEKNAWYLRPAHEAPIPHGIGMGDVRLTLTRPNAGGRCHPTTPRKEPGGCGGSRSQVARRNAQARELAESSVLQDTRTRVLVTKSAVRRFCTDVKHWRDSSALGRRLDTKSNLVTVPRVRACRPEADCFPEGDHGPFAATPAWSYPRSLLALEVPIVALSPNVIGTSTIGQCGQTRSSHRATSPH
jgi:hypothetical protein